MVWRLTGDKPSYETMMTKVSDAILTHWGRKKMDAISQTTFWSAFSWMEMFEFRLKFHWSLFLRVKLTIFQHWFRIWRGAVQATSHYRNQWWLDYRRIYASLGLYELINIPLYIQMEDYICGVDHSMPLLLLGDTGSGKSALMAKVATMAAVAAETSQVDGWVSRDYKWKRHQMETFSA